MVQLESRIENAILINVPSFLQCVMQSVCGYLSPARPVNTASGIRSVQRHLITSDCDGNLMLLCFYTEKTHVLSDDSQRVNPVNTQLQIQPNQQHCLSARETHVEDTIKPAVNLIKLIRKISCRENINVGC